MKKAGFLFLSLLFVLSACTRVDKVLPKKEGTWLLTQRNTTVYEEGDWLSDTIEYDVATYFFGQDGSGTITDGVLSTDLTWDYNNQDNILTLTIPSVNSIQEYSVLESKKDRQLWFGNTVVRLSAQDYLYEFTLDLVKQE